jgi:uncharacterized secreted protein with C-terminal beta-propeller domain
MTRKLAVLVAVAAVAAVLGACDPDDEASPRDRGAVDIGDTRLIGLVTEDGCADLLSWLQREADAHRDRWHGGVIAFATGAAESATDSGSSTGNAPMQDARAAVASESRATTKAAPPQAGVDYSTTNVQEEGVDEPDIVKTDGRRLVALAGNHLRVVDVTGDQPRLRASLPLVDGGQELLLAGDRVLVISPSGHAYGGAARPMPMPVEPGAASDVAVSPPPGDPGFYQPRTTVTVVDVSDADAPKVTSKLELDGNYVASRVTDGVARLVLRATPPAIVREQEKPLAQTTIDDWLPRYRYTDATRRDASAEGRAVECGAVRHPVEFAGADLLTVVSVDPADPRPGNGAAVVGAGETVYASHDNLYVTSNDWHVDPAASASGGAGSPSTQVHAFDISDEVTTKYVASGRVEGQLLNSFAMSEHEGVLRVATTTTDIRSGSTESRVVVLRADGDRLAQVGAVGGLGKGERIYAVRFLGDQGYVVTFRQVDPLYVLDLSDPEEPELKGELKIPGYSSYLHPIAEDRLLGIGQAATDQGRRLGTQASVFDVSDPANPKQVAVRSLGSWGSEAEYDHHAFLWWAKAKLAVVPVEGVAGGGRGTADIVASCPADADCPSPSMYQPPPAEAVALKVDGDSIGEEGRIKHPTGTPIRRSLVVGDRLLTLSEVGLLSSPLDDVVKGAWLAF